MTSLEAALRQTRARDTAKRASGLDFYTPHEKQSWFHSNAHFKRRLVRPGNRFGKSTMGAAEDVAYALGYRPWIPEGDEDRYLGIPQTPTKGLLICTSWEKADEIFTSDVVGDARGKLRAFIPENALRRIETNHGGHPYKFIIQSKWGGESVIQIDTVAAYKQNPQKSESSWWDWIHVDEPIPEQMWEAVSRGLMDRDGSAWFTCTLIEEPWIARFFGSTTRQEKLLRRDAPNNVNGKLVILGSSTDNPFISTQGISSYVDGLSPEQVQARLHGTPLEQTGIIYYMFSDDHIYRGCPDGWTLPNKPPHNYTIRYAVDPHPATPHAVLFLATAPDGTVYCYDEIFEAVTSTELAASINEVVRGYTTSAEIGDPSAWILAPTDKRCLADDLAEAGLYLEKGQKDPQRAILLVRKLLSSPGKFRISESCMRTLYEFDNYVWDDPRKRPNKPRDKDDHMMENLGRLCMSGLDHIEDSTYDVSRFRNFANPYLVLR